jgi:hypothetical protein
MPRLTITLSEQRHMALKERAARTSKSIGLIIEESLENYGVKTMDSAADLVSRARRNANLNDDEALSLANHEVRAVREA